ncbi:MAG: potassium channel family protein [Chloroflexia bacterium]
MILALLMVPALIVPEVFPLEPTQSDLLDAIDWFIYACFAADYLIKLYLAPSARQHIKDNWLDLLLLALPLLRPLRIVRSARLLRLVRVLRLLVFLSEGLRKLRGLLLNKGLNIVLLVTATVVVSTAALVYIFERNSGGSIKDFPDALWWAMATITTVGYGDVTPITPEGRGLGVFLMLVGIVFFSILTANLAAYFVEGGKKDDKASLENKLDTLLARLEVLEDSLARLTNTDTPHGPRPGR